MRFLLIVLLLIGCATSKPKTDSELFADLASKRARNTEPDRTDKEFLESKAKEIFESGIAAESLCEKAILFDEAAREYPDTKHGKLSKDHLARIRAKWSASRRNVESTYKKMAHANYSQADLRAFRNDIQFAVNQCSYQPEQEVVENFLNLLEKKYPSKLLEY